MTYAPPQLDERFTTEEMISASELQERAIGWLEERMKAHHKLLLTHYNRPVGVLLEIEVFKALVRRLEELEEKLESLEAARFIRERLRTEVPDEEWLPQEQLYQTARRLMQERFPKKPGGVS